MKSKSSYELIEADYLSEENAMSCNNVDAEMCPLSPVDIKKRKCDVEFIELFAVCTIS